MAKHDPEVPDDIGFLIENVDSILLDAPPIMAYSPGELAVRDRVLTTLREAAVTSGYADIRSYVLANPDTAASEILWHTFLGNRSDAVLSKRVVLEAGIAAIGGTVVNRAIRKKPEGL